MEEERLLGQKELEAGRERPPREVEKRKEELPLG